MNQDNLNPNPWIKVGKNGKAIKKKNNTHQDNKFDRSELKNIIDIVLSFDCPIINLSYKIDYLNFIGKLDMMEHNIIKGIDSENKNYIAIKAEFYFDPKLNKQPQTNLSTFCPLYEHDKLQWENYGPFNQYLFFPLYVLNVLQLNFINKLLNEKDIKLDENIINKHKLLTAPYFCNEEERNNKINYPIGVRLGWSL
jgi:hypothetical protein